MHNSTVFTKKLWGRIEILGGKECPPDFHVQLASTNLRQGLEQTLKHQLDNIFGLQLLVVDTLQKVRGVRTSQDVYGSDYADLGIFKRIADEKNIAVLVVHHTRKGGDGSPFERISGSNGVTGAADTEWVLLRDKSGSTLHITGRDVSMEEIPLRFDKEACRWEIGEGDDEDPELTRLCELVTSGPERTWQGTAQELLKEAEKAGIRLKTTHLGRLSAILADQEDYLREKHGISITRIRIVGARILKIQRIDSP